MKLGYETIDFIGHNTNTNGETVLQIINNIKHEFCVGGILLCIVLTLVSTGMDIFNFLSNHASFPLL